MAKYLVTGGAGLIGSQLADILLRGHNEVVILDDFSTGFRSNIFGLEKEFSETLQVIEGSILDVVALEKAMAQVSGVFHLAAALGVKTIIEEPLKSLRTNTQGTENVLALCAAHGVKVFLASTSEVYGKQEKTPFNEEMELVIGAPSKLRWSYAISKLLDEAVGLAYHYEKKMPVVIGRYFNVIGARQNSQYGMVVPKFIRQALAERPITVFGDGSQIRTFTQAHEAAVATINLFQSSDAEGQIVNIGSRNTTTILELAKLIKKLTNSCSTIESVDPYTVYSSHFDDMYRRVPNIEKLETITGSTPKISLEDILAETIEQIKIEEAKI